MRFQAETDGAVTFITADDGRASIDMAHEFLQPCSPVNTVPSSALGNREATIEA
jgi:hypothetical protein